ncbi:unnamed protein product [Mytilus edulis]|uniref:Uncharacterized protein n=1 Tax=Mytilus edulis TaxID=6550 RepID=A0A8S3TRE8_MYTED|nr:unnamed protein product [Mytilus edulis]
MFSAKCSIMLQEHNIKIDWSRGDLELRQMVCAGSTVNMCNFCSSTLHKSSMCGNSRGYQNSKIQPTQDKYGRDIVVHDGIQICNNFNQPKGCVKPYCRYAHVCKICKKTHGKFECSTNKSMPGTQQEQNKSFPKHYNVNDLIDKDQCSLTYIETDDASNAIQRYGSKSLCYKVDISDAFKQLPIKNDGISFVSSGMMNTFHQLAPEAEKAATPCLTLERLFGHRSRKFTSFRCCRFN